MMKNAKLKNMLSYAKANREKFKKEWFDYLTIPSISAESNHYPDVVKASEWVAQSLTDLGLDVKVHKPKAEKGSRKVSPIVVAEKIVDKAKPTLLVYGHYDVQPTDPLEKWWNNPFVPLVKNGRVYARGASDDKGQSFIHIKALESMLSTVSWDDFPINIKYLIEGEEEIGSPNLFPFLEKNKKKLTSDVVLISDTEMLGENKPALTYGLRGLTCLEVTLQGSSKDIHSGMYGGVVANPANYLVEMLAKVKLEQIAGFFDGMLPFTKDEEKRLSSLPFDKASYYTALDIKGFVAKSKKDFFIKSSVLPTFDINGIFSGYSGEGSKTIIPGKASAKISFRLSPNQSPDKVNKAITKYLEKLTPKTMTLTVEVQGSGEAFYASPDGNAMQVALSALKEVYGCDAALIRSGGSIPIVSALQKSLGAEVVLMGFGLAKDNIHSPNESFALKDFYRGVETSIRFMNNLNSSI